MDVDTAIRMMLIEDDLDTSKALQIMLAGRDIEVSCYVSAESALSEFDPARFDVIVSDIRLGGMSGVDLLREVREKYSDHPVILLTGFDSLGSAVQAVRLGAQDYILKPLETIDDLVIPVRKAVHSYRLSRDNAELQKSLSHSEAMFRAVLSNTVDVIYKFSLQTNKLEYISPSSQQVLGYTPDELGQMQIEEMVEMVHPDDIADMREFFDKSSSRDLPQVFSAECRIREKDGDYVLLGVKQLCTLDEAGASFSLIGNARDITQEKETERRNMEIQEVAAKSKRIESLGILAGGVAHDLNNILGAMIVIPDLIMDDIRNKDNADELEGIVNDVSMIKKSSVRAAAIIKNLVMMSRRKNANPYPLNINNVVRAITETSEFLNRTVWNPDIKMNLDLADNMNPVLGCESNLIQVIMNLIINAYDALDDNGTVNVQTEIREVTEKYCGYEVVPAGEYAVVTVFDDGPGIPPEYIEHIFEPFYTKKRATSTKGTGLGLAVVHSIIKDHKGYIDVISAQGKGARFEVYLPVTDREITSPSENIDTNLIGKGHVLIVDDMPDQLLLANRILTNYGYTVDATATGREAVDLLKARLKESGKDAVYDLVLLDMVLEEDFDGLDTLRRIKKLSPNQKCIIASAFTHTDTIQEAERLGLEQFVAKPYTMKEMGTAVKRAVSGNPDGND